MHYFFYLFPFLTIAKDISGAGGVSGDGGRGSDSYFAGERGRSGGNSGYGASNGQGGRGGNGVNGYLSGDNGGRGGNGCPPGKGGNGGTGYFSERFRKKRKFHLRTLDYFLLFLNR